MNNNSFKEKYLKYKNKYLELKNQFGGECVDATGNSIEPFTSRPYSELEPTQRITINGKCYSVVDLFKFIMKEKYFSRPLVIPNTTYNLNEEDIYNISLAAVQYDGILLQSVPYELHNNQQIVTNAVQSNNEALEFAGEDFLNNPTNLKLLSSVLHRNPQLIEKISSKLNWNSEIVYIMISVVTENEDNINYVPYLLRESVKNHADVILANANTNANTNPNPLLRATRK